MDSWIRNQEEVFGRGLNLGQQREKERIIKLLEEHMPNSSDHDFVGCECEYPTNNWYNNHLVALIKGEK